MKNNPLVENNVLLILRGVSGSGKSTFADFLEFMIDGCEIETCTADDYHYDSDGNYNFKLENLGKAHKWCQDKAQSAMQHNVRIVIVGNTTTSKEEAQPYIDLAKQYDYRVVSLIVENLHGNPNIHNVPDFVLDKQKQKLLNSFK
jgi:predicted kinase